MIDKKMLEVLACPKDKGPLFYFSTEDSLYNPRLKRRYDIKDEIPVMLIEESEVVDDQEHTRLLDLAKSANVELNFEL